MNEETKEIMKKTGVLLAAGIIGGFVGGVLGNCCSHCFCHKHPPFHHGHMMPPGVPADMMREFDRAKEFDMKMHEKMMKKMDEFKKDIKNGKGEFIEEEYIIVPKEYFNRMEKNAEPADKPFMKGKK